ncbi:MAG TPA: sialate O-acetylesterase, partial [Verrucomicrobiae bacterium]|nr:sialate O-acetylesterase [Verrucomicrobiae bacterium]
VPKLKADAPVTDVKAQWVACDPANTPGFSAVGYYFGRALQQARGVPVGLIHTSWGGSPAEVWMSQDVLASNADYKSTFVDAYNKAVERNPTNKPFWKPSELYNGMIAPLLPYAIKGAIWYQGESNAGRAWQYRSLYTDMIRNWRRDWQEGNFTFLCVQLAPWDKNRKRGLEHINITPEESDWAELRDAQLYSTTALPNVGMAVITDVGDKDDIHPTKKKPVGERLALAARSIAYGEKITGAGPTYRGMTVKGNTIYLSFDNVGKGLEAGDGKLTGFAIAAADQKFVWANAEIVGDRVAVSSPLVPDPVAVRYGWSDYPVVSLWNKDGLPATPFRTDRFPLLTQPKQSKP